MTTAKKTEQERRTFSFTLILAGRSELTQDVEDAFFEAGCDDALLGVRDGVLFLDFEREASAFPEAVVSAITDVQKADVGAWVARVEPDDLVTASEIARRVHRSRESIRQLAQGERGPGTFPPPIANVTKKSRIWRWAEVCHWFSANYDERDDEALEAASVIAAINSALELRRHVQKPSIINKLWTVVRGPEPTTHELRIVSAKKPRRKAARKKP